ncbi:MULTISPECIES: pilus assembly protein N-terminal domain-containing protein [Brevundimonas]|uniref:pilus assembly protein N-terminal domain-containing protein n=1 Tax=Brevundimonas TaxID=41275 RepID=UPI001CFE70A8|nr:MULTISPECIES: pilus assembly protein N-terminal domain-containing protein [Brevundimonas]
MFRRMAKTLMIAAAAVFGAALATPALAQDSLRVDIDQTARIQLRAPAGSVIVGNPQIADITVVDANTLYVTGKGYGITEIVAVDSIGRTLFQSQIIVSAGDEGRVRVWRGGQVTEMACGSTCSPTQRSTGTP